MITSREMLCICETAERYSAALMFLPCSHDIRTTESISSGLGIGTELIPELTMTLVTPAKSAAGSSFTGSTVCPISWKAARADSVADRTSLSTLPSALSRIDARRSFRGRLPTAALNGSAGGGAQ